MPLVTARFTNQVYLTTDHTTVLGLEDPPHELHLLDRLNTHYIDIIPLPILRHCPSFRRIGVCVRAVHTDPGAALPLAVDPDTAQAGVHSRREPENAGDVAARERQFTYL